MKTKLHVTAYQLKMIKTYTTVSLVSIMFRLKNFMVMIVAALGISVCAPRQYQSHIPSNLA